MGVLPNKIEQNKKYKRGLQLALIEVKTGRDQRWRAYASNKPSKPSIHMAYGPSWFVPNYFLAMGYSAGCRKYGIEHTRYGKKYP